MKSTASTYPKTATGVLIEIAYGRYLLVPSAAIGTLAKILEQLIPVESGWVNGKDILVDRTGDSFSMKVGSFTIYTPDQEAELVRAAAAAAESEPAGDEV